MAKLPTAYADLGPPGPFTLGTVQLGMPYGLGAARSGLDETEATAILSAAARSGVRWLDTAHAYGEAEARAGRWMAAQGQIFKIVTKLPALAPVGDEDIPPAVEAGLAQSLKRLGVGRADVCLTHGAADLLRPPVADALRRACGDGAAGLFGASVYTVEETRKVLAVPGISALQVPLSVVSHAVADAGLLEEAAEMGIAVFARSVFLQGALLLAPDALPAHLECLAPAIRRLRALARDARVSLPNMLIAAVSSVPGVYSPVLGADSAAQVEQLASWSAVAPAEAVFEEAWALAHTVRQEIVDPRRWPKAGAPSRP